MEFTPLRQREIRAQLDGEVIISDGGCLLLRKVEKRTGIVRKFAACFRDYPNPDLIEQAVEGIGGTAGLGSRARLRGSE